MFRLSNAQQMAFLDPKLAKKNWESGKPISPNPPSPSECCFKVQTLRHVFMVVAIYLVHTVDWVAITIWYILHSVAQSSSTYEMSLTHWMRVNLEKWKHQVRKFQVMNMSNPLQKDVDIVRTIQRLCHTFQVRVKIILSHDCVLYSTQRGMKPFVGLWRIVSWDKTRWDASPRFPPTLCNLTAKSGNSQKILLIFSSMQQEKRRQWWM